MNELATTLVQITEVTNEQGEHSLEVNVDENAPVWKIIGVLEYVKNEFLENEM